MWACNTFGDLRIICGICTSKTIDDLSKENDIHVFVSTFHTTSDKERWQSLFTNEVSS
jgi:hypothetical protein